MDVRMLDSSDAMVQMLDVLYPGLAEAVSEDEEEEEVEEFAEASSSLNESRGDGAPALQMRPGDEPAAAS